LDRGCESVLFLGAGYSLGAVRRAATARPATIAATIDLPLPRPAWTITTFEVSSKIFMMLPMHVRFTKYSRTTGGDPAVACGRAVRPT
jgi:hypothetical protein